MAELVGSRVFAHVAPYAQNVSHITVSTDFAQPIIDMPRGHVHSNIVLDMGGYLVHALGSERDALHQLTHHKIITRSQAEEHWFSRKCHFQRRYLMINGVSHCTVDSQFETRTFKIKQTHQKIQERVQSIMQSINQKTIDKDRWTSITINNNQ